LVEGIEESKPGQEAFHAFLIYIMKYLILKVIDAKTSPKDVVLVLQLG
jgi:hypothetical protein